MNNKKLKSLIALRHNVRIFVPSTIDVDKELDNTGYVDAILKDFSEKFGGATSYLAMGAWSSPQAGLVKEKVTIVEAFCTEAQLEENIEKVIELAEDLKRELKQEAIALQINNELYFV